MATMEDLIATISGSMHVSQDGYDLKALQAHLAQTIFVPSLSHSPNTSYRRLPASRSTSVTRKPVPISSGNAYSYPQDAPLPSPVANMPYQMNDFDGMGQQRPNFGAQRRTSYGFANMAGPSNGVPQSPGMMDNAFDGDAFAPLWDQGQGKEQRNVWGQNIPQYENQQQYQTPFAPQAQSAAWAIPHSSIAPQMMGRPPTPPDEEDECMDEDMVEDDMEYGEFEEGEDEDEEHVVSMNMGIGANARSDPRDTNGRGIAGQGIDQNSNIGDQWGRGRWK